MKNENLPILNINKAQQIAFVVNDLEKSMESMLTSFGIGPWSVDIRDWNSTKDNSIITDMVYMGKPGRFCYQMGEAVLPSGLILELIQPLSGENIYTDFLRRRGEGMHHIGWHIVDSYDEFLRVTESLEKNGFPCLQSASVYASRMAYFDTTKVLNTILEVSYRNPARTRPASSSIYPNPGA